MKIDVIKKTIIELPFVNELIEIKNVAGIISGKVSIYFENLEKPLIFNFEIHPQYPFKTYETESIKFINKELIQYNHVMEDGSICIHTSHSSNLIEKIKIDFNALVEWIKIYFLDKKEDNKYEHIIVNEQPIDNNYYSYLFTDTNHKFQKGEFGEVNLLKFSISTYRDHQNHNFLVQSFISNNGKKINCQWNSFYNKLPPTNKGIYVFIKSHPAKYNRFAFNNWTDLRELLPKNFASYLYSFEKTNLKKFKGAVVPIFIGYEITKDEIHWQVALEKIGNFPTEGFPIKISGIKTGKWGSQIVNKDIVWGITRNISYKYFYGRGTFSEKLINSKILIIGIGAIGSILAKTLVKGGCKYIDVVDYDVKEPENVCRSEYLFSTGLTNKTDELIQIIRANSPFVETNLINNNYFEHIKSFSNDINSKTIIADTLSKYDIIFDCSTDNDLMYILNSLKIKSDIINLSITNHANELVCAFYPNLYHFVRTQFEEILDNDIVNLYEPTGCWSPTFKASYNDINTLLQIAIKHINEIYKSNKKKNNFIIKYNDNQINIQEF